MNSSDERDIRARLDGALATIVPGDAPVVPVIQRGRAIRMRRRAGLVAGVAAAAVLAAVLPGAIRSVSAPAPSAPAYHVTVNSPGPDTPSGVIGSGLINGKPWQVKLSGPVRNITVSGPGLPYAQLGTAVPDDSWPVSLASEFNGSRSAIYGTVSPGVSRVTISLPGGTVLSLTPVAWRGSRWIALVLPVHARIVEGIAYSRAGELAYAIPYASDEFVNWLRPGQRGLARVSRTIGFGTVNGTSWSAQVHAGPWGLCVADGGIGLCADGTAGPLISKGMVTDEISCGPLPNGGWTSFALAASSVRHIELRFSDGSTFRARTAALDGQNFFAFAVGKGLRFVRWTAYGASRQVIGRGSGWKCGL